MSFFRMPVAATGLGKGSQVRRVRRAWPPVGEVVSIMVTMRGIVRLRHRRPGTGSFRGLAGLGALALVAFITTRVATQGSGPAPILLVVNTVPGCTASTATCNPFGPYLAEILRAEGINAFDVVELANLQAATLASVKLVVLAETPLSSQQAQLLSSFVEGGGRLIAMRPDAGLAPTLGLSLVDGETTDGYIAIDTAQPAGAGLPSDTLPFRGPAAHYSLGAGAEVVAALYASAPALTFNGPTTGAPTGFPAVVRFGRTATWSFDLARSVAYTRQGDPALAGEERDGIPPLRTLDVFFGTIDLDRMHIPHADVHMRLFARVVGDLLADAVPLPRFWYFPGGSRTLLVVTGDDHNSNNYSNFIAGLEARGVKGSLYVVSYNSAPDAQQLAVLRQTGHEFGLHPWMTGGLPWSAANFHEAYQANQNWFTARGTAPSRTVRTHQVAWLGWVDAAKLAASYGIGLDTSFYSWGPTVTYADGRQAKGFTTGSGLPMRFVDEAGVIVPVYQQVTALVDEQLVVDTAGGCCSERLSAAAAIAVSRRLIDDSQAGGYSALTTQFHVDHYFGNVRDWADGTVDYALSLGVPVWTAERWLRFTEARAATTIADITWQQPGDELSFTVLVPAGAEPQQVYVPWVFGNVPVRRVSLDGVPVSATHLQIAGRSVAMFGVSPAPNGSARSVRVKYGDSLVPGNSVPVARSDEASTSLGTAVAIPVLSNDSDPDADALEVVSAGPASGGEVTSSGSGAIVYAPSGAFCGEDRFDYTVSDGRGGFATASVSVIVACTNTVTHTTVADFSRTCAIRNGVRVTSAAGGEVRLAGEMADEFQAATLGPQWVSSPTPPVMSGGVLSVIGPPWTWVWTRSAAVYAVGSLDMRIRFGASAHEHAGWGSLDFQGDQYLIFSSFTGDGNLYARSNLGTGEQRTSLGPLPSGFHDYRIERIAQSSGSDLIRYYMDGGLVAEHVVASVPALHVYFSSSATGFVEVDSMEVAPPYVNGGTYDSCAIDAGDTVTWMTVSWVAQHAQGVVAVRTRTSADGTNWSPWSPPLWASGQLVESPVGRYLQYRLELATGDPTSTPVVESISVFYGAQSAESPVVTNDVYTGIEDMGLTVGAPGVLANDVDPNGRPLTVSLLVGPRYGGLVLNPDGSFIYTPAPNFWGTDSFGYVASNGNTASTPALVTLTVAPVNDEPVANPDIATTAPNRTVVVDVLANDMDADGDLLAVAAVWGGSLGTPAVGPDGRTVVYTPVAGWCGSDTVSYSVTDGHGGVASSTVAITVSCGGITLVHSTVADFTGCSTLAGTRVVVVGDGAVQLAGTFQDGFDASALSAQWVSGAWSGGSYEPILAGGILSLGNQAGAYVRSAGALPMTGLDVRARFGAAPWEHIGWGALDFNGPYVLFSTFNGTTNLYARTYQGSGGEQRTDLGPIPTGFHDYRIARTPQGGVDLIQFIVDGSIVAEHTVTPIVAPLHVYLSHNGGIAPTLDVDSVVLDAPHVLSGTFEGCALDAEQSVTWGTISWVSSEPTGTFVVVRTRTSPDGASWSAWSDPVGAAAGNAITSPPGRYLQYRLELATGDSALTPIVEAVTVTHSAAAPPPTLAIDDVTLAEGDGGATVASFTVTLSQPSSRTVTVDYATADGTATAGSDYIAATGTLSFAPGTVTQTVGVTITGDVLDEPDETFVVVLSNATGAALAVARGTGTIADDDNQPDLAINDIAVLEGSAGSVTAMFLVTLSAPSGRMVMVDYTTVDGTATAGLDYMPGSGTLTFTPGVTSLPVVVSLVSDSLYEATETFGVRLRSPVHAALAADLGVCAIEDDDPAPAVRISDAAPVTEPDDGTKEASFLLSLSAAAGQTISVHYATQPGTATNNVDFEPIDVATVTFSPGETTKIVTVQVRGDLMYEPGPPETFFVNVGNAVPAGVPIADGRGVGSIVDNDPIPTIAIEDITVTERNSNFNATFTIRLSNPSSQSITVAYGTQNGTATASTDYVAKTGTVTFGAGTLVRAFTVTIRGDRVPEPTEHFYVNLTGTSGGAAVIGDGQGVCTILDDDS
jgi:hypothetical protein